MVVAIFGYSGFVGSNILQFYKIDEFYNSKNISDAKNKKFKKIFFCAIPSVKWYANKNPFEDLMTINNIQNILKTIKTDKFILISTIDVYDNVSIGSNERYSNML